VPESGTLAIAWTVALTGRASFSGELLALAAHPEKARTAAAAIGTDAKRMCLVLPMVIPSDPIGVFHHPAFVYLRQQKERRRTRFSKGFAKTSG